MSDFAEKEDNMKRFICFLIALILCVPFCAGAISANAETTLGDVDGDGKLTTKDALKILKFAAYQEIPTEEQKVLADINTDGAITTDDVYLVLYELIGPDTDAGYIKSRKKLVLLKCILEFGILIAIFWLGIVQTKTRLNLLTVIAVLGCLPASKALVEFIMILPHKTIDKEMVTEIESNGEMLLKLFDTVFTSEKKIMPVKSIVIR